MLKPVDDTRLFEKIGVTLAEDGEYEVTIIGYPSVSKPNHPGIEFKALNHFERFSVKDRKSVV